MSKIKHDNVAKDVKSQATVLGKLGVGAGHFHVSLVYVSKELVEDSACALLQYMNRPTEPRYKLTKFMTR